MLAYNCVFSARSSHHLFWISLSLDCTLMHATSYAVLVAWSSSLGRSFVWQEHLAWRSFWISASFSPNQSLCFSWRGHRLSQQFSGEWFQLLPLVLGIFISDWQFHVFLSGLELLLKLNFPRQQAFSPVPLFSSLQASYWVWLWSEPAFDLCCSRHWAWHGV